MTRPTAPALKLALVLLAGLSMAPVPAAGKDIVARSHCPLTGMSGTGRGATFEIAQQSAIKACIRNGGTSVCCVKHVEKIAD